jgi:hypothetical protein
MNRRDTYLLWMKDLFEQLEIAREQLQWTSDDRAIEMLIQNMQRDLETCKQLCETMKSKPSTLVYA